MPGGDRTGPVGAGPMTGRGVGFCSGNDAPGYMNPGFGRGRGFGRGFQGRGRGWRNQYYATGMPGWARANNFGYSQGAGNFFNYGSSMNAKPSRADELSELREQARYLRGVLDDIEKRVNEIKD